MQLPNSYDEEGHPIKCPICGAPYEVLDCYTMDRVDHIITEQEWRCTICMNVIAYWAYGYFEPIFKYGKWE